jgi:putative membrane protein
MTERRAPHSFALNDESAIPERVAEKMPHSVPMYSTTPVEDAPDILAFRGAPRRAWIARIMTMGLTLLLAGSTAWVVEDLIATALLDNNWAAWLLIGGLSLSLIAIIAFIAREWLALENLDKLRGLRAQSSTAHEADATTALAKDLKRLYGRRPDLEWAWANVDQGAILDETDPVGLIEREIFGQLDAHAQRIVIGGIRRSATVTAVSPFPALDILATAAILASMLRQLARLYGGRPGWLATWRLLRMSLNAVLASGLLDLSDDTIGDALGVGLLSKLSRRASVGMLNGLLTARVGVSAISLIRPLPLGTKLSARGLAMRALTELQSAKDERTSSPT